MAELSLASFESPPEHMAIGDLIRRRSTNPIDVRDAALQGLELSYARHVLDLGCGFGFMTEAVARRVAPDAVIVGIDACSANEGPYLERMAATGRGARFICRSVDRRLEWPDASFDLVVSSYALYFFPGLVPEVARVLAPHGLFLATTHTESSCLALLEAVGLAASDAPLLLQVRSFSAESGAALLAPWFEDVERVDYRNALRFEAGSQEEFLAYLRFKLPQLIPQAGGKLPESVLRAAQARFAAGGQLLLEKDDAIFRCRKPRCR